MKRLKINKTTYGILVFSEMVWAFASGILGPVYAIFVEGIGGGSLVDVGLAYAILLLTSGILSIPFSNLSDKIGRKKVIIMACLAYLPVPFIYPSVINTLQIFILQAWDGVTTAMGDPVWEAVLAEATESRKRGRQYGLRHALNKISAALAALVGGVIAQSLGFKYTFYFVGVLSVIATVIIFFIEDKHDSKKKKIRI